MQQKEKQDNNAMGMKKRKLKAWQMSTRLLYAMIGVTAVVFALFYLVGYDMPYVFDPDYNAPLLTDIVLIFIFFKKRLLLAKVKMREGARGRTKWFDFLLSRSDIL